MRQFNRRMKAVVGSSRCGRVRHLALLAAACFPLGMTAKADWAISDLSQSYKIDFDTTVPNVNNGVWAGSGFDPGATVAGYLDSNSWAMTGWSDGELKFGDTKVIVAGVRNDFTRGALSGNVTTGGVYAFSSVGFISGAALGFQQGSNDWDPGTLTLRVKNNTTSTLNAFDLSYIIYARNDQTRASTFNFSYSTDGTTYTPVGILDFTSPGAVVPPMGFIANNRSTTISGLSIAGGAQFYLRWSSASTGTGSRDELALDDIRLSNFVSGGALPANLTWAPATDNNWSVPASANWNSGTGSSVYKDGDTVTFNDAGAGLFGGVVSIAGPVQPGSVTVNSSGNYTLSGPGSIDGNASLTKSGAGTLAISNANSYGGGTMITGGTIVAAADNSLGFPTSTVTLDGPTAVLRTGSAFASARSIAVNAGGGTIDTNGFNSTFAGLTSASGAPFIKAGAGRLTFTAPLASSGGMPVVSVSQGELEVRHSGSTSNISAPPASGGFAGNLVLGAGTRVNINGGSVSGGGTVRIEGTGASISVNGTSLTTTIENNIVMVNPGEPFTLNLGATGSNTLNIGAPGGSAGGISGTGDVTFGVPPTPGTGTVVLNVPSAYTGKTAITVGSSGYVRLGTNNALPATTSLSFGEGTITTNIGTLDLNGFNQTVASLSTNLPGATQTAAGISNSGSAATLTIDGSAATVFSAPFNGNVKLAMAATNTGTLRLTGASLYSGGTEILGGTLLAANDPALGTSATGPGAISVGGTGTLGGTGRVSGLVTLAGSAAAIAPGNPDSAGTLTLAGGVDLSAGGTYRWQLADYTSAPGSFDQIVSGANSTIGAAGTVFAIGFLSPGAHNPDSGDSFWNTNHSWTVFDAANGAATAGNFATILNGTWTAGSFSLRAGAGAEAGDLFLDFASSNLNGPRTLTWNGTSVNNWDTASINWYRGAGSPDAKWESARPDNAVFDSSRPLVSTSVNVAENVAAGQITFAAGSGSFYLFGPGSIAVGAGGLLVNGPATISSKIQLTASQSWNVAAGQTLYLAAQVDGPGKDLTKTGPGNVETYYGNGLTLNNLTVSGGKFILGSTPTISGTITLDSGTLGSNSSPLDINTPVVVSASGGSIETSNGGTVRLNSPVTGGILTLTSAGSSPGNVFLNNAASSFAGLRVSAARANFDADSKLGAAGAAVTLDSGGALVAAVPLTIHRDLQLGSGGGAIDSNGNDVVLSGSLLGGSPFTKQGAGTLSFAVLAATARSGVNNIDGGVVHLDAVDLNGTTALGTGTINIHSGGTLFLDSISVGDPATNNTGAINLYAGSTLKAKGTTSYARSNTPLVAVDDGNFGEVDLLTTAASDVFKVRASFRGISAGFDGGMTVHVKGPGRILLASGPTTSPTAYAGSWQVEDGILQIGPADTTGPECFNALGYKTNYTAPNAVKLTGGVLALGVNAPNSSANPGASPPYVPPTALANAITLEGGAIAAIGAASNAGGNPTPFGGDLTINGNASRVLVYDPVPQSPVFLAAGLLDTARNVAIVGSGNTNWNGTLTVDPRLALPGGTFFINRSGGTATVTAGAKLAILAQATVIEKGSADPFCSTVLLNVENAGQFTLAASGARHLGQITGTGGLTVDTGASLAANSVRQNTLTVNGSLALPSKASGGLGIVLGGLVTNPTPLAPPPATQLTTDPANPGSLNLGPAGVIDVNDSFLMINYSTVNPIAQVAAALKAGRNAAGLGAIPPHVWDGTTGIMSSAAAASFTANLNTEIMALGVGDTQDMLQNIGLTFNNIDGVPLGDKT
ncbi:MAG: beta strand repeat-containing protein, partial [Tepidisphaerales bacterium]